MLGRLHQLLSQQLRNDVSAQQRGSELSAFAKRILYFKGGEGNAIFKIVWEFILKCVYLMAFAIITRFEFLETCGCSVMIG